MRHFFKFAMCRQIKNIVATVMQVIATFTHGAERRIARRNARKRHRFFRFNDMGTVLQDRCVAHVVLVICRVEIFFVVFYFAWLRANRSIELLFVLVVVDAFVQLVAGLHGVDDAFLRAFLTQDVVDMFSGAVHGTER